MFSAARLTGLLVLAAGCAGPISSADGGRDASFDSGWDASAISPDAAVDSGWDGGPDASHPDDGGIDANASPCNELDGAGAWEVLGVSVDAVGGDTSTSMASVGRFADGAPVVAFREPSTPGGAGDILVRRWNGTSWVTLGSPLSAHPSDAESPSLIVDAKGGVTVAWSEGSPREVHVWRFREDAWTPLGAALSANPGMFTHAELPSLAVGPGDELVVCWQEVPEGSTIPSIHVRGFDGAEWQPLGPPVDRLSGDTRAIWPEIAISPTGEPHLVWVENAASGRGEVYVARWSGTAWEDIGGPLSASSTGEGPALPAIAFDLSGAPIVAFGDNDGGGGDVYLRRWNGTAWDDLGSPSVRLPGVESALEPALATDSMGRPIVAFRADGVGGGVYVSRLDDAVWFELGRLGGPITDFNPASEPDIVSTGCGDPIVVWQQARSRAEPLQVSASRWVR